ncbi:autophagy-related protein 22-like protein [Pyronema domesticum]|uniref:Autophagy-related protein n=1 Tax=Pyronema omphalodes (strain CBS 100304) TaxID=1076935 RepID=U4LFZ1_PYROM|nr:autophagy-related protein 22-like protein [Pyronema domesticum]CCX30457.1 Similar to Autophagy-related protein 22-1; acc. no. A7KAM9 [Pyronema omphalodes CBS 100304]
MPSRRYSNLVESNPEDADDERSMSDADDLRARSQRPEPLFPGQDVRPTSRKELMGWYSYAWAAEVFVVCGIGSFIPVTLEQLARENGVLLSDPTIPCTGTPRGVGAPENSGQCVVYILGARINTASFAMYTFSISVLLQSLIIVSMSGAADHGAYRKQLLLTFAMIGSIATMMFITVTPSTYILSAVWATFGNIGFGASFVLLNAFLPVLVRHHPTLLFGLDIDEDSTPDSTEGHSLLINTESPHAYSRNGEGPKGKNSPELSLSTQISSYGIAIGYTAAVLLQIFSIMVVLYTGSTLESLKVVLFIIGLWWFVFSIPPAMWLRPRPGPPLPVIYKEGTPDGAGISLMVHDRSWWGYIKYSWVGLGKTIMRARRLKDVMLFLAAWFLVSDGVATVSGTAVLFGKTNLHMKPAALALISVVSTVCGVFGAFGWPRIAKMFNRTPSQTILICMCVFLTIPLYGLLGFIPAVQRAGVGGLTSPWEMYVLGAVYGFVLGGVSGYCRSVFGELIPPGSEAAFYALYAVTDKGSSIFGPTIVGAITDKYGDIRVAFWFLTVLLSAPLPLIYYVDVSRGRREGRALAAEELALAEDDVSPMHLNGDAESLGAI